MGRKYTEDKAKKLGLVGWVMNTPEGTVVGQAQGDEAALQHMYVCYARIHGTTVGSGSLKNARASRRRKWLQEEGSPKSQIDRCEFTNERKGLKKLDFNDFSVKRPKRTSSGKSKISDPKKKKTKKTDI